jgi:L-iditol 2-dehydrogenase
MRAVVFHGPDDLRIEDVPEPVLPRGGLIVRPRTVGICGSDIKTWHAGNHRISGPQILGHETAGIVVESDDAGFPPGMAVALCPCSPCLECEYCQAGLQNFCPRRECLGYQHAGGMADLIAVPAVSLRVRGVVPVPSSLPLELAALAEPLHTVLNGQDRARTSPTDSVLILGLGPIGILHAAVARSRGAAPVLGVDPVPERATRAAAILGSRQTLAMAGEWESEARARVEGSGWDLVVIANGSPKSVETALSFVAPLGRILAFAGLPATAPSVVIDWNRIHYQQIQIIGAFGGTPAYFRRAMKWLASTDLELDQLVTSQLPLEAALDAFKATEHGEGLKTMLRIS